MPTTAKADLRIDGRDALKQLLTDVESKSPGFKAILVYDVSRWGRFQDADESAYYEYICRLSGIEVRYCAEQFENDGSVASTISHMFSGASEPANYQWSSQPHSITLSI
jgi:DNA invertase Pin-like site-specific DNA recombinase